MDDLLMNALIAQMAKQIIVQELTNRIVNPSCDICDRRCQLNTILECAFCEKKFCPNCCGKPGTVICKQCNWLMSQALNFQILNGFSVKELRVISDNYKISVSGIREKGELIEEILKEFKKSIQGLSEPMVNVDDLRHKMIAMKLDEASEKEITIAKEKERAKLFENFDRTNKSEEPLTINFKQDDHLNVHIDDIPGMSVKEIKSILDSFQVDYSHAIEKKELVDLATNLTQTYNKFRAQNPKVIVQCQAVKNKNVTDKDEIKQINKCIICMAEKINAVFLNCAHCTCCYECATQMDKCPICRAEIQSCMKIFMR